jgi:hypothetical protein
MQATVPTITGKVNLALLDKADRLFRNDDEGTLIEVLQNARRAGATTVDVLIEEAQPKTGDCTITIQDDGGGIENFQSLLTLGASDWSTAIQETEDPAGMGFFSLCRSGVEVHSGDRFVKISPSVFLGRDEAAVETSDEFVAGTRMRFTRASTKTALAAALERVAEFYPLEVRLNGQPLTSHEFLEGALYRERIDGIEVGFSTAFTWWPAAPWHDLNWNFYGARVHQPFETFSGLLGVHKDGSPATIYARFNVLETGRVKLQLPDRHGIIEDEQFREFLRKARAAAYRFFQTQPRHALPFRNWQEARELGVELPEAAYLLKSWHATPLDDNRDPLFGHSRQHRLDDLSNVILIDRDLPHPHTLEAALECGAALDGALYQEQSDYAGYSWYKQLPRIVDTEVFVDGIAYEVWQKETAERPERIEIEITIERSGQEDRNVRLPAMIHVDSNYYGALDFVAVNRSPWDNEELRGPFSIIDFLMSATFCASDDADCDSWETQLNAHQELVEREVNAYFRGPRATLLAILREAIDWTARDLAEQAGVKEIRFNRAARHRWDVELAE